MIARADARLAILAGLGAGLAASPIPGFGALAPPLELIAPAALALAATRPRQGHGRLVWLTLIAACAAAAGLLAGTARTAAIDRGALRAGPGHIRALRGYVAAVPRRTDGAVRAQVQTPQGRLLVEAREPVPDLPVGAGVRATGELTRPPDWYRATLRRQGIATILRTERLRLTGTRRGGLAGALDAVRSRAEAALGTGMPPREAALARGFVLGQDDRIDAVTVEDFRRSGLAHLLAVSGQNVVLLALLAAPLLAALGVALRPRLFLLGALVAVYVPLAGGGPSIQRAGVMGLAGLLATAAGRPASRLYALLLAVAATLALNPRASGDPGWQLSFAAVLGIYLLARPLHELLAGPDPGSLRRAAAEGAAVTVAATLATAPIMAEHFGTVSVASLVANLLALPAVAPAMWLGMIVAGAGQLPGLPVAPLNGLEALLLGYIAQIASWLGRPGWATASITPGGPAGLVLAYACIAGATLALLRARPGLLRRARPALAVVPLAAALLLAGGATLGHAGSRPQGLRVEVIDVGQGDAILLQPPHAGPILVDGGPPGDGIEAVLRDAGVRGLAAAVVTHDQSDHSGGIGELLGRLPVRRLLFARAGRELLARARAAGATPLRVAEGSEIRSGGVTLDVLWPPRVLLGAAQDGDPNLRSLVMVARWREFSILLTGDAEAEAVPIDPGPVDVIKIGHHGSEDAGLGALLARTSPQLAVISVGADNPYGHPAPATLADLARHGVPALRTDLDGTVVLDVSRSGLRVDAG